MRDRLAGLLTLALAGCNVAAADTSQAHKSSSASPVVIELFQSQGCSSCPPADANLNALADRTDIIALNFAVTYWDYLGWKDTFAKPAFTRRQQAYAAGGRSNGVYTPQIVINGRAAVVGANARELGGAIGAAGPLGGGPRLSIKDGRVAIPAAAGQRATLYLVTYDPRVHNVAIRAGENGGRTIPHRNIVTALEPIAEWSGAALSVPVPRPANPALRQVVLLQRGNGGELLSALRL